jgi:hypothetical protein
MDVEAEFPETDESSTTDGAAAATGVVVFIGEIGVLLSVGLRRDKMDPLLPVSTDFAAGSDFSVGDSGGESTISTRRFCCRPASEALLAIGFVSPYPTDDSFTESIPPFSFK